MNLDNMVKMISLIGGLFGLISGGIIFHDKYYIEPNQSISQLNKNIKIVVDRIKEINKELSELHLIIDDIKERKLEQSHVKEISDKLDQIKVEVSKIETSKVDRNTFNQYHHLSKDNVIWITESIKNLQGTANLSNQIFYWESEINNIKNKKCYDQECVQNKNLDLKDAQKNLLELQKLLINK